MDEHGSLPLGRCPAPRHQIQASKRRVRPVSTGATWLQFKQQGSTSQMPRTFHDGAMADRYWHS